MGKIEIRFEDLEKIRGFNGKEYYGIKARVTKDYIKDLLK